VTPEQKKTAQMYHMTFTSPSGSVVLDDMESSYGGQTYVQGDAYHSAFQEGQRSVVLAIKALIALIAQGQTGETEVEEIIE
jgi:hypothetical protein